MAETMKLEILTPDEIILNTHVDAIRVQLSDGWWGILPGHAPFMAHIVAGIMLYRRQEETRYVALYQGTIEMQPRSGRPDRVLVLNFGQKLAEGRPEEVQNHPEVIKAYLGEKKAANGHTASTGR